MTTPLIRGARSGVRALCAVAAVVTAVTLLPTAAEAQATRGDYARAEQLLPWNAQELLIDDAVRARWMPGDRFWYRNRGASGWEFMVVEMATGAKRRAFDHGRLASALSIAADTTFDVARLPFRDLTWVDGDRAIRFSVARGKNWTCELTSYRCTGPDTLPLSKPSEVKSPDGSMVAYERGGNLYVRPAAGGAEKALTTDGTPDWGYALSNIGCCQQVTNVRNKTELRPQMLWSPDSKRLVATKWDQRNVRLMHLLETKNPGPVLHSYRYALPGDSVIPRFDLHVFDVAAGRGAKVDVPQMDAINTTCCWLSTDTVWKDVRWGSGGEALYFTAGKRGNRELTLMAADPASGRARTILTERGKTFVETNQFSGGIPNWRVLSGGREVVWWSERDGWGHLYLVNGETGEIRNRITSGDWLVADVLWIDEVGRWVYYTAVGREPGRNP